MNHMTDDIMQWLGEQLAEDERVARAASDGPWRPYTGPEKKWQTKGDLMHPVHTWDHMTGDPVIMTATWADSQHIATHDPERVLREIDANRRRLERHTPQPMLGRDSDENDPSTYVLGCPTCQLDVVSEGDWPCEEARDMLVSYADRPGYREEWRP
jgi:hypothetical protein